MKARKLLALGLTAIIGATMMAGCGGGGGSTTSQSSDGSSAQGSGRVEQHPFQSGKCCGGAGQRV